MNAYGTSRVRCTAWFRWRRSLAQKSGSGTPRKLRKARLHEEKVDLIVRDLLVTNSWSQITASLYTFHDLGSKTEVGVHSCRPDKGPRRCGVRRGCDDVLVFTS